DHVKRRLEVLIVGPRAAQFINSAEDWSERGSQFMGHRCQKLVLQPVGLELLSVQRGIVESDRGSVCEIFGKREVETIVRSAGTLQDQADGANRIPADQ